MSDTIAIVGTARFIYSIIKLKTSPYSSQKSGNMSVLYRLIDL